MLRHSAGDSFCVYKEHMCVRYVPRICCVTCYALVCTIAALLCVCKRAARLRTKVKCVAGVLFASVVSWFEYWFIWIYWSMWCFGTFAFACLLLYIVPWLRSYKRYLGSKESLWSLSPHVVFGCVCGSHWCLICPRKFENPIRRPSCDYIAMTQAVLARCLSAYVYTRHS